MSPKTQSQPQPGISNDAIQPGIYAFLSVGETILQPPQLSLNNF